MPKTIAELQKEARANSIAHGFDTEPTSRPFPEAIALMHSELSEALEEYRIISDNSEIKRTYYEHAGSTKPLGIPSEFADVAIRLFETAEANGIDLQSIIEEKMAYNATRPFKHGGKRI